MELTVTDYLRKGHKYLETTGGRKSIFDLYRREIEEGITSVEEIPHSITYIKLLTGLINGDSLIFLNSELPNIWTLIREKENISKDALDFLREILGAIKPIYLLTDQCKYKFHILYLLLKFLPELNRMSLSQFTDLYLIMFHTTAFLKDFKGNDEEHFDLGDIAIRGFCRYDCAALGESFLRDKKLKELLPGYKDQFEPYEKITTLLNSSIESMVKRDQPDIADFVSLLFTETTFLLLDDRYNGFVREVLKDQWEEIGSHINERVSGLFENGEEGGAIASSILEYLERRMIKNKVYFKEVKSDQLIKNLPANL